LLSPFLTSRMPVPSSRYRKRVEKREALKGEGMREEEGWGCFPIPPVKFNKRKRDQKGRDEAYHFSLICSTRVGRKEVRREKEEESYPPKGGGGGKRRGSCASFRLLLLPGPA